MKEYFYIPLCELVTSLKSVAIAVWCSVKVGLVFMITYFLTIIAPVQDVMLFACLLVIIDWVIAFSYAVKNHCIDSKKRWKLATKMIAYFIIFVICGGIMTLAPILIGITDILIAIILMMEIWSILANLKMLFPNMLVLDTLQTLLQHEINRKKGVNDDTPIEN